MTIHLVGNHIYYKIITDKNKQYIEVYDYKNKTAFMMLDGEITESQNKLPVITLRDYEIIPWPFKDYIPKKELHVHRFLSEVLFMDLTSKEIPKSCSNCKHHTWDWDIHDGHYRDEYSVCLKNNDLNGPCEDYEEM